MPNEPIATDLAHTEDLSVAEYDAGQRAKAAKGEAAVAADALPANDEVPEVGLSQKGEGEDAVVKRETEI